MLVSGIAMTEILPGYNLQIKFWRIEWWDRDNWGSGQDGNGERL